MRFRFSRRPFRAELTIPHAVAFRAGAMGVSRWPPFLYPEVGLSIRWGRSCGARVWRHYGLNLCDLGTFALSVHQRRLHLCLLLVHLGADLPWACRDGTLFRVSLYSAVERWRRRRATAAVRA